MGQTIDLNKSKVDKLIEAFKAQGKTPEKLEFGYRTYARLAEDDDFFKHISKSADDKHHLYRGIRIKLITEKYHFKVK
ncbi:hypothetical protein [Acinetobacter larvae]|uniref:Uncharacterized protein n=1 Tax=Acinetobacter larvae TaxID=1789224 RepID=A0A1B2LYU4_9GAMM|nr:hypothetical protein [Acinetobacter larvae]AOA58096.1 hypothetical protein BFG52_06835 [Acinetobacter larvae]